VKLLSLRSGIEGKASFKMKAGGGALAMPDLPLAPPIIAQVQASNDECWEATFSAPTLNTTERLRAESD
jgi:hypothetical protein